MDQKYPFHENSSQGNLMRLIWKQGSKNACHLFFQSLLFFLMQSVCTDEPDLLLLKS